MKARVLKELTGYTYKVGDIIDFPRPHFVIYKAFWQTVGVRPITIQNLLDEKTLELVEEPKSLEEKFEEALAGKCIKVDVPENYTAVKMLLHTELDKLAQIAEAHFKENA